MRLVLILAFLLAPMAAQQTPRKRGPDVLETAYALAEERFKGFVYGPGIDSDKCQIDCTCFVWSVVEELAKACGKRGDEKASRALRRAVLIANLEKGEDLHALVDEDEPRIMGVVTALVDAGLGRRIDPKDARPGDFVQYWYRPTRNSDKWAGHASLVERIEGRKAVLLGSHKSTLRVRADGNTEISTKQGGIGSGPVFDLTDPRRKVFVVRWTAAREPDTRKPGKGRSR